MAVIAKQRYKLDIAPRGGWVIVYVSQHDDGAREIEFEIINQGRAFSIPASINVSVQGIKSNGSYFSHSCSYSGNIVTMALADDMTDVIGKAICVLKFTNSFQQKLATAKFVLNVDSDSSSEGVIIDTEAEEIFNQMLNEIRAQAASVSADIAELQSMVGTPLVASSASAMTNHNKIYVYIGSESGYTNGNWYYWNGSAWTSGGVYNSIAINIDSIPTQGSTNAVSSGGVYDALQNVDVVEYQLSPVWFIGGFVDKNSNGVITSSDDANWTYTQFYKIPDTSSKVRLSVYAAGNGLGVAFYTSTGTFISGTNITSKLNTDLREYDIPANAVFVRFTNNVASNYHPATPLIIFLRNKTSVIIEDEEEIEYKQLIWRTGVQLNGAYYASGTRMCTIDPISIDKPTRISLADDWRAWVSYYKNGVWVKDGIASQYDGYVPEPGYDIYITLAKRDNSVIIDGELAIASKSIAVILADRYEEERKAEQYAPNWASISLFQNVGVLGDSFASGSLHYPDGSGTAITNYAVSWPQILARDIGVSVTNYSKGGLSATTWLTNEEYGLAKLLSSDPEQLYICDFGINDWNQRSTYPIGTVADCKEDYTENPQTFYGSYGKVIGNIMDHAPNAKIIILSVMRNNERQLDGDVETVAEHFELPFIKITDDDFFVSEYYAQSMYGNHPLAHGYAGIAEAVKRLLCKCIMKNTDYFRTYYG